MRRCWARFFQSSSPPKASPHNKGGDMEILFDGEIGFWAGQCSSCYSIIKAKGAELESGITTPYIHGGRIIIGDCPKCGLALNFFHCTTEKAKELAEWAKQIKRHT